MRYASRNRPARVRKRLDPWYNRVLWNLGRAGSAATGGALGMAYGGWPGYYTGLKLGWAAPGKYKRPYYIRAGSNIGHPRGKSNTGSNPPGIPTGSNPGPRSRQMLIKRRHHRTHKRAKIYSKKK